MSAFSLELVHHGWLPGSDAADDLCSHGAVRLSIGGVPITNGTEDYGISESALAMLRTLHADRLRGDALAECMILHGCGAMLGSGCGIGVDWTTRRREGLVHLSEVVRYDAAGSADPHEFPAASTSLPFDDYARAVTAFARLAREPFERIAKRFEANELFPGEFLTFWDEYDRLLAPFLPTPLPALAS